MKISVALAAYNGEKYIKEQIVSILDNLSADDELIISDDNPKGKTKSVIESISDGRIKYIEGPSKGVIKNFENAIKHCTGDIIILSDQDDVWFKNKVSEIVKAVGDGADMVVHNAQVTDVNLNPVSTTFKDFGFKRGYWQNIIKNTYIGCCMAFRKEMVQAILPFPEKIPMHDQWIALIAEKYFKIAVIDTPLMNYRRHSETVTGKKTTAIQKIIWRKNIIFELSKYERCGLKNRGK